MTQESNRISEETAGAVGRELENIGTSTGLWLNARTELHLEERQLVVFIVIPDVDPFEPSRLDRIFDTVERVVVGHIPHDILIHERGESWTVSVDTPSGDLIDGIFGGEKIPTRTIRLSDGLGPPTRP